MLKRVMFALLTIGALMGTAMPAEAAQTGSIQVVLETKSPADISVTLYHAGDMVEGGYRLEKIYGEGLVRWGDLPSEALASWLAEHAAAEGVTMTLDADGSAFFPNLAPGLYLIKQTAPLSGDEKMKPFVVELPYEDIWQITVRPQAEPVAQEPPATGQSLLPIAALPVLAASGLGLLAMAVSAMGKNAVKSERIRNFQISACRPRQRRRAAEQWQPQRSLRCRHI